MLLCHRRKYSYYPAIAKDCNILDKNINLKKLGPNGIEEEPELMNSKNEQYIKKLLENQPKAITGNSFYNAIGGLICDVCKLDANLWHCPKTDSQAMNMSEKDKN